MANGSIRHDLSGHADYGSGIFELRSTVAEQFKSLLKDLPQEERSSVLDRLVRQEVERRAKKPARPIAPPPEEELVEVVPDEENPIHQEAAVLPVSIEHFPPWQEWTERPLTPESLGAFVDMFVRFVGEALKKSPTDSGREAILKAAEGKFKSIVFLMYKKQVLADFEAQRTDAEARGETAPEPFSESSLSQSFTTWLKVNWPNIETNVKLFAK